MVNIELNEKELLLLLKVLDDGKILDEEWKIFSSIYCKVSLKSQEVLREQQYEVLEGTYKEIEKNRTVEWISPSYIRSFEIFQAKRAYRGEKLRRKTVRLQNIQFPQTKITNIGK